MVVTRPGEEVIVELHPERISPASEFRSTWLAGSVRALRARGLFDAYFAQLSPEARDAVLSTVAGLWLPISVALEHYEACDRLGLDQDTRIAIGREVTTFAHGTVLDTTVKLARGLGATPWTVLGQLGKLWSRIWVGGGVGVVKTAPKDARIQIAKWACARVPYCRDAMQGVLLGVVEMVSRRAYVHPIPGQSDARMLGFKITWA